MKTVRNLFASMVAVIAMTSACFAGQYTIGFGAAMMPEYEGAEDYTPAPIVLIRGDYSNGMYFSLETNKLSFNAVPSKNFRFGPLLNYRLGREDVENDDVDLMEDIDGALEAGLFGSVRISTVEFKVEFLADTGDAHEGYTARASLANRFQICDKLSITPKLYSTYADEEYTRTWFGIDNENRGASGFQAYDASSGMKDFGLNLAANYRFNDSWGALAFVDYKQLVGDAADSPIVKDSGDENQLFFGLAATYLLGKCGPGN